MTTLAPFAPVPDETEAHALPVTGALPPGLTGRYLRNGPNPLPGEPASHVFTGHGMLHGVRLRDGHAEWYRNRWIRTRALDGHPFRTPDGGLDRTAVHANTHVIRHAGRVLALVENGFPYEVTPDLGTVGPCDFDGRLTTAMTAHPKEDPLTGELHFFGYGVTPPYLTYHRLTAAGELAESREIPVPGPTMVHDFAVTAHHLVWLDLPMVFAPERLGRGMPYRWDASYGARIGLTPRARRHHGGTRWFDIDPCYVFHVGNAYEDAQGRVVLDAVRHAPGRFSRAWERLSGTHVRPPVDPDEEASGLHRWALDPATGTARSTALDDQDVEFPTVNDTRATRSHRYLYAVTGGAVLKYDTATGASVRHETPGTAPGEAEFVPAPDATGEDDGWLLTVTTAADGRASDLLVLDATTLRPTATVHLPRRVPAGFHGSWLADVPEGAEPPEG